MNERESHNERELDPSVRRIQGGITVRTNIDLMGPKTSLTPDQQQELKETIKIAVLDAIEDFYRRIKKRSDL